MTLDAETIVVGAGFGGLGLALQLRRRGERSFLVLERAAEPGGTWRDNVYPGCACDIPALLYSFSFEPGDVWQRRYPEQPEILGYLKRVANRPELRGHVRYNSALDEARFDEPSATWRLRLGDGSSLVCRTLVLAMGALSRPHVPAIAGAERFTGATFHSAQWDPAVELRGKNVAVVGTGASAIQFVPQIAPDVARLTLFQRTPSWIIPRGDKRIGKLRNAMRAKLPGYAWLARKLTYWTLEFRALGFVVNPKLLRLQEALIRKSIADSIADPALREKLTPEYRAGCKRVLISDDYYPALQRSNVELLDSPLAEIRERSVVAADGTERAADVIIYGTGFNATGGFAPVRVFGRNGLELSDAWRDGMSAYLGTSVAGFPNMFLVIGPNTGLGHNSMVIMMEAQYAYILAALDYLRSSGVRAVDVQPSVQSAYNEELQQRLRGTVWATGCSSWYIDAGGKNTALWPGFTFDFRNRTKRFDPMRYRLT